MCRDSSGSSRLSHGLRAKVWLLPKIEDHRKIAKKYQLHTILIIALENTETQVRSY
jgi:hypothetical protein